MSAVLPALEEARQLVLEYGWNSTCYQVLNASVEHWWAGDRRALVGFVRFGKLAIVAGAPICSVHRVSGTIHDWEAFVEGQGLRPCYFGAESRLRSTLGRSPQHVQVVLGSQPEWHPRHFVNGFSVDASLRAQLNRARNKGVEVNEWSRDQAENNPELHEVLREWLAKKGLPMLHFLVEPETLGDLRDRRIFVASQAGRVVGFVTLCPAPARSGWLTEQFVRSTRAPNGTVELMLYVAANHVRETGARYLTMGIVPLIAQGEWGIAPEPAWLGLMRRWAKAHYTRFYNFRGLYEFKAKFHPSAWQPVVVVVKDKQFRFTHLRAIAGAFTQTVPEFALAVGLGRGLRWELERLATRRRVRER